MADQHEIALEGLDKVQAAVKAVQDRFKSCQAATTALTEKLIQQTAAASGLSEKWVTQALKTEIARQKLKDLTEQTIKYGLAVVDSVQRKAVGAWQLLTVTATGFAGAGIRSSAIGEIMAFQLDRLARVIGGLVAPEVEVLIRKIEAFSNWITRLNPAQKELAARWIEMSTVGLTLSRMFGGWIGLLGGVMVGMGRGGESTGKFAALGQRLFEVLDKLMPALEAVADVVASTLGVVLDGLNKIIDSGALKWIAAAGAALLFAGIASRVVAAITVIIGALKALTAAKITALAFSGPAGWAALATGAVVVVSAMAGATLAFDAFGKGAGKASKAHEGLRNELSKRVEGMESFEQTWARIAAASVNVGRAAEQLPDGFKSQQFGELMGKGPVGLDEILKQIERNTAGTREGVERQRPAVGK